MNIGDDVVLPRLIGSLETSAREIDRTFARAGAELGEGLTLFEALKERLSGLSTELAGDTLKEAGTALSGVAGELRAVAPSLQRETAALQSLAKHGHDASHILESLLDHMRLITILARSARIESVLVQTIGNDFNNFTVEIVGLTSRAQQTIQDCLRDHERLAELLDSALKTQRDFESRYGRALSAIADDLDRALAEVAARQQRGAALAHDAAVHSGKIAAAVGGAIVSLQTGDSIRQRLEHVIAALRLIVALDDETGAGEGLAGDARAAAALVLRRLQAEQLRESAMTLGTDAESIESALALLADDTGSLLDLVKSLYQGEDGRSGSFLGALEVSLAQAAELFSKCNKARATVDKVTQTLTNVLDACQQTVAALGDIVSDIELIGVNVGLRAARVGNDGRGLLVIAHELKCASDMVVSDAQRLKPTFANRQEAAAELKQEGQLGSRHFAELDLIMRNSLAEMGQAGDRLGEALAQLVREGGRFSAVLAQARLSFSNAGAASDLIAAAGDELARATHGPDVVAPAIAGLVDDWLQTRIWPRYTMAVEREIHRSIVHAAGLGESAAAPVVVATESVDDLLF